MVANPVRGLLDRKRSEEHLKSSNESMTVGMFKAAVNIVWFFAKTCMFYGVFQFAKNMKFLIRAGFIVFPGLPGALIVCAGPHWSK